MENIIAIKGNVKYSITLDPGVWIFDDRRIDLDLFTFSKEEKTDEAEEYTKAISKHWDREITEGAISPSKTSNEKRFKKEKILNGTFGIPFKPFLLNAEPLADVKEVIINSKNEDIHIPIEAAYELILQFSNKGKPLKEDGPVHVYFGDGSNKLSPIKDIRSITVR